MALATQLGSRAADLPTVAMQQIRKRHRHFAFARSVTSLGALGLLGCHGATRTVLPPAASPGEMAFGLSVIVGPGAAPPPELIIGEGAYSGRHHDTLWKITADHHLLVCRGDARAGADPACSQIDGGTVVKEILPSLARERTLGRRDSPGTASPNRVWIWGHVDSGIARVRTVLGLCSAEGEPECHLTIPAQGTLDIKRFIAAHSLGTDPVESVVWLSAGLNRGIMRTGGEDILLRCESQPQHPIPSCEQATFRR